MKASIGLLVLFLVTKQVVSENAGNFTTSNESSTTTAKPFLRKVIDAFKGMTGTTKKDSSTAKEDNTTLIASAENSTTYNATSTTKGATATSKGTPATTGATKSSIPADNTTKGSALAADAERGEVKKTTLMLEENTAKEDSSTSKVTQGYSVGNSEISESAPVTAAAPEGRDIHKTEEDASNPSTNGESLIDIDSNSPEEASSDAPKHQTDDDTGTITDDDSTSPKKVENTDPEREDSNDTDGAASDDALDWQQHQEHCTVFISKLVSETLTKHADKLDPLLLRDRKMAIEVPFLFSSVEGQVGFYDGKITGISQGKPFDECKVEEMAENQIRLVSGIHIDKVLIKYKGRATLMEFGPRITVDGKLSGITADLSIAVPKDGGIGRVEAFRLRRIKRIEIDVKGLGAIDWAVEVINEETARFFTFVFTRSIERDLRKALEDEIAKTSYP